MRRILVTLASTALLACPVAAEADTPGCVSRHEYDRASTGMTMTKVHTIFDTEGSTTRLGAPNQMRYYRTCSGRGRVQVVFTPQGRLLSKTGHFF